MGEPDQDESMALAVRESDELAQLDEITQAADAYEQEYMPGAGMVLYRDKQRATNKLHAVFGGTLALMLATAFVAPGAWIGSLVGTAVLAVVWLLFSVLRVTVSQGHVNIQYGLFGPKIPISAIESAEAVDYDWKDFGGWGIRVNTKGEWAYNMLGDGGHAVRIVWRQGDKQKVVYVSSQHAPRLAEQIMRARALAPAASPAALPPRKNIP